MAIASSTLLNLATGKTGPNTSSLNKELSGKHLNRAGDKYKPCFKLPF